MTTKRTYGRTKSGTPIDDEMVEQFVEDAERGYEPGRLRRKPRGRGRPPLGDAAKEVESVRLDPELRDQAAQRGADEGVTVSEIIRRALRTYLRSA
jgi:Ribbon-helix-helix protein, copG family